MAIYAEFGTRNPDAEDEEAQKRKKRIDLVKKIIRFLIITACTCYCFYFFTISIMEYMEFETSVAVNVHVMRELVQILPGITVCSPSLTTLKKLDCYDSIQALQQDSSLPDDERYRKINSLVRKEIGERFGAVSLGQYFNKSKQLTRSDQLIDSVVCDRMTWKKKGKFSPYSLPHTCDNVFKVRSLDRDSGSCFTLFHRMALNSMLKDERLGVDEIEVPDPEQIDLVNLGSHTPKLFVSNGLLDIKLNYNLESYKFPNQSTEMSRPYGGKLWIHSNRIIPHISMTGFTLFPNRIYTIYITKDVFKLMEPPYKTMCRSYEEEYALSSSNLPDFSFPLSRDACIDQCIISKSLSDATCKCWPPGLPYRRDNNSQAHDLNFCSREKEETCYSNYFDECFTFCPPDCHQESYKFAVKMVQDTRLKNLHYKMNVSSVKGQRLMRQYANEKTTIIKLVFATNEETHHVHKAKVNFVEMSVEVAGLFGLFLAFSFDYFIDLFEYVRSFIRKRKRVSTT